ncbi:MAG: serine hydrolase domain-containing protein [Planctomycetota bacterium]
MRYLSSTLFGLLLLAAPLHWGHAAEPGSRPAAKVQNAPKSAAAAQVQLDELEKEVERLARPLIDEGRVVGMTVGVVHGDKCRVWAFGRTGGEGTAKPDGKTVYEIGSISKVFTGTLLADMVERGEVRLDTTVASLLPAEAVLPEGNARKITLLDLATHTSGYPRLPSNMLLLVAARPENPYADYTPELLHSFLESFAPAVEPGQSFLYSNLGVGLLGHLLAKKADKDYESLLVERIAGPLGMSDTRICLNEEQKQRFAQGYGPNGKPAGPWDIPTLAGAGGIRSTVDDMLKFAQANLVAAKMDAGGDSRSELHPLGTTDQTARHPRSMPGLSASDVETRADKQPVAPASSIQTDPLGSDQPSDRPPAPPELISAMQLAQKRQRPILPQPPPPVAAYYGAAERLMKAAGVDVKKPRRRPEPPQIALGWHYNAGDGVLWHNGQTGGYHSYLAIQPEADAGVVVLSNASTGAIDRLGGQLLRWLARSADNTPEGSAEE